MCTIYILNYLSKLDKRKERGPGRRPGPYILLNVMALHITDLKNILPIQQELFQLSSLLLFFYLNPL